MIDYGSPLIIFGLSVLAMFALIPSKLELGRKLVLLAFVAGVSLLSFRSINSRSGLPTPMPELKNNRTLIISYLSDGANDTIYMWLRLEGETIPKTFSLPYSEKLHKELKKNRTKYKGKPYFAEVTAKVRKGTKRFEKREVDFEISPAPSIPEKKAKD